MDTSESTAKIVDMTYKNIMEEFGPYTKQLVAAGRTYLKSLHAMVAASRQYTDALAKIASLANNSTLSGCRDIGTTLYNIVDVNKEILAQQSNIIKSLEFDFLEPMEIAAEKDTKLVGREQKRFQQLYKGRREAYLKCVSTLKKTRRKKNINTDKQLSHMKMLESAKERLEVFCNDSLKEVIIQERVMYGTVLERQCALNRQFLTYHGKGSEILEEQLPHWESIAETRDKLPESCYAAVKNGPEPLPGQMQNIYSLDSMLDVVIRNNSIARSYGKQDRNSMAQTLRLHSTGDNIYARPIVRAKSEYCLPTSSTSSPKSESVLKRFSKVVEYNSDSDTSYARALYAFEPSGDHQLALQEGDILEYITEENTTGWQFGDNLTSGRSGWFPVTYTEPVQDPARYLFNGDSLEPIPKPPPPPPPATISSVRSKVGSPQHQEISEYATLTRTPKKLLAVDPPSVATFDLNHSTENGTLKSKHYASHPDILEATASLNRSNGKIYHNGQHLPSMRL
ncbi:brain-specific angiogenesis inhibitor 1-associated protein 2-like [Uloborus diversus]|uniref:brain-specific angiogenesis inhibitor 1-associated protein 2-like n=1 Tax=Uloborus diversus TaxID=327109 RepID=UPI0024094DF5|nr:brain-specific angiogenesis inhibitor 1-associated protein 2-like [Uloborus diversus]